MAWTKPAFATAVLFAGAMIGWTGGAAASDADFRLKNATGYQIDEVYVSRHSSKEWGRDIMGRDALNDGDSVKIVFPHNSEACDYDIKVKYHDDGSTAEWSDVDLCKYETITIYWDDKRQVSRAVGE
jgi:hypothetical protein